MKNTIRHLPQRNSAKRPTTLHPRKSRSSPTTLSLVPTDRAVADAHAAPLFLEIHLDMVTALAAKLRAYDGASPEVFTMLILHYAQPDFTGLERRAIAAEMFIAPITLQRWSRGESLPSPLPRKAFILSLADLIDDYAERVRRHGLITVIDAPKRGARRKAAASAQD